MFDIVRFSDVLYKECKHIFPHIIEELAHEKIYSLALYNSGGSWSYLFPTVATKLGLSEVASKYKENERFQDQSAEELEADLKWSPCDSPRHSNYEFTLTESVKLLQKVENIMVEFYTSGHEDKCDQLHDQLTEACITVLKQLDSEGVFYTIDRNSFVLNLLTGDQSNEERLERAKILNPERIFKLYESEI